MTTIPPPVLPQLVVGYDDSEGSVEALRVAALLATRLGAQLHVLHVVDLNDYPVDPDCADWEERAKVALQHHRLHVQEQLEDWKGSWSYHSETGGSPVQCLSALANDVQALFIVVGTRGGGIGPAMQRLVDGSVSRGLVHGRYRPVLVVPKAHR